MSDHEQGPMASPARDVRKLKRNSTAAAGELKEFLGRIQGKSPKEMMGVMASSSLFRGLVHATLAMAVLVLILTVVPYAWGEFFSGGDQGPPLTEATETQPAESTEGETKPDESAAADPNIAIPPDEMPADIGDPAKVIDTLGVGETKEAPANVNPLEGAADDLLKGLD